MEWLMPLLSLALLLLGMAMLTASLRRGPGAERLFARMRMDTAGAFAAGLFGTVLLQSSSASTVLIAGACDAGRLGAGETAAAIMGANVGTTLTGFVFCLGLGGGSWLPEAALAAALAVSLLRRRRAALGAAGMLTVFLALRVLRAADVPALTDGLLGTGGLHSFFRAAGLTAVLQSSSACIGFLQAAARTGVLSAAQALPAVLGCNVGTCATALLSALPGGRGARRAALMHLAFNLFAAALSSALFALLGPYASAPLTPPGVAALHTLVNLLPSIVLLALLPGRKNALADSGYLYYDKSTKLTEARDVP